MARKPEPSPLTTNVEQTFDEKVEMINICVPEINIPMQKYCGGEPRTHPPECLHETKFPLPRKTGLNPDTDTMINPS